ncbi:hypothetical protein SNF32_14705 [Enterococcus mundtii]|nr:hypothetical protein [Enterococcus mundtii]
MKHRKTRVVDISEKLMFSKSYSYKLISRLKDIFHYQKIPITINSNLNQFLWKAMRCLSEHIITWYKSWPIMFSQIAKQE